MNGRREREALDVFERVEPEVGEDVLGLGQLVDRVLRRPEELLLEGRTASPLTVRLIGIGITGLIEPDQIPLDLFPEAPADARASRLNAAVDRLQDRFGSEAVRRARSLLGDKPQSTDSTLERRD